MSDDLRCGKYTLVRRLGLKAGLWNAYVDAHPEGCWWHRGEWLDYCLAYAHGNDHSVAIMEGETVVGLLPLIVEQGHFKGGRNPLACAIALEEDQELNHAISAYIKKTSDWNQVMTGEYMVKAQRQVERWKLDDDEHEDITFESHVVDLTLPVAERKRALRDSYKSLVTKYACLGGLELFDAYQQLHQDKYNHPRAQATYDLQKSWCEAGFARVYAIPSESSKTLLADAASLWFIYKQHAYYASAVNTGQDLAHPLMWFAMNDLARLGVKTAEIGWQGVGRTTKEKNIEFWKRGWGGTNWTILALRCFYGVSHIHKGTA